MAEVRVVAHQVPEDRPVADVDQRLRNRVGVLAQARAQDRRRTGRPSCESSPCRLLAASTARTSPAASSADAARASASKSRPDRCAMATRSCAPSARLSTQSKACSNSPGAVPPTAPYRPRLPSRGSPFGLRLRPAVRVQHDDQGRHARIDSRGIRLTESRSSADVWYSG